MAPLHSAPNSSAHGWKEAGANPSALHSLAHSMMSWPVSAQPCRCSASRKTNAVTLYHAAAADLLAKPSGTQVELERLQDCVEPSSNSRRTPVERLRTILCIVSGFVRDCHQALRRSLASCPALGSPLVLLTSRGVVISHWRYLAREPHSGKIMAN